MGKQRYFVSYQSVERYSGKVLTRQTCFLADEGLDQEDIKVKAEIHLVTIFGSTRLFTIKFAGPLYGECYG